MSGALEHRTSVRKSGDGYEAHCLTKECAEARPDGEKWSTTFLAGDVGNLDAAKMQAERAAAVHRGDSVRSV